MSTPLIPPDPKARPAVAPRDERVQRQPDPDEPLPRPEGPMTDNAHSRGDGSSEHPN